MSLIDLRVELPTYAHSFTVQVPNSCTVLQIKERIHLTCTGAPRVDGQRIIWRGRYLTDQEKVEDVWKSPDEPRIIHLSVHPSAWTSSPPNTSQPESQPAPSSAAPVQPPQALQMPPRYHVTHLPQAQPSPPPSPTNQPLTYVLYKHQNALLALMQNTPLPLDEANETYWRRVAQKFVERHGWAWPSILDEEFPPSTEGGLQYERTNIDGQPYLRLCNPSETPTDTQVHALKVLSYTFTLLRLPLSTPVSTRVLASQTAQGVPIPAHVNALLQQLGLPALNAANNQHAAAANANARNGIIPPELREIPIRPFLLPISMLIFRTLLLLYFVAPARKPVFGILILAWVLYEIWQPIRNGLMRGLRVPAPPAMPQQGANPGAAAPGAGDRGAPAANAAGVPRNANNNAQDAPRAPGTEAAHQAAAMFDTLANMNIPLEEQAISGTATEEPSFGQKAMVFLGLLATTVHPAVWNRRRAVLRQREGRIRTEAVAREAPAETGEDTPVNDARAQRRAELAAQHARRPRWVQAYMRRVVDGDWVDDSD